MSLMALAAFMNPACLQREEGTLESGIEMEAFLRDVEKRAYRITVASIRDADEALDIVQEAMINLVRKYSDRSAEEWRPLFYRILKNKIRDWQRRGIVRGRVMSFFGGQEGETYDPDVLCRHVGDDVHAIARFRVEKTLMHLPYFAEAFGCPAGSRMSRPEDARCVIYGPEAKPKVGSGVAHAVMAADSGK